MKRVLVRPPFQDWCGNRLFSQGTSWEGVYRDAFSRWRSRAEASGIRLDTWDQAPLEECDCLWFLDLPASRREFERIRDRLRPDASLVLQVFESPAIAPHGLVPSNQTGFRAVVTYEDDILPGTGTLRFHYKLPVPRREPACEVSFAQRRGLLMLYSNRVNGFWAARQPGLAGLPFFGRMLSGWDCPISLLCELSNGDLYSSRRAVARAAERSVPGFLDLFGTGWNGEEISWWPYYANRPYGCWRGKPFHSKQELCAQYRFVMAYENFHGRRGYISEKIFDALQAGSVPVYLGDERIAEFVPVRAFVDARNFPSPTDLLEYLEACPESQWLEMREVGQRFLCSGAFNSFTDEAFAETMLRVLNEVL